MNIFSQFVKSLYSPKAMASFRFQGIGKTILYVFLLVLITSIPLFVTFGTSAVNLVKSTDEFLQNETPDFYIQNGEFFADIEDPFISEEGGFTIILDPDNELSLNEISSYEEVIAIQSKEIIFKGAGTTDFVPLSDFQGTEVTKDDLISFMDSVGTSFPIIITILLLLGYLFFTATKFIQITILALFGLFLKNTLKRNKLQYRHTWILSAYAVTLPTLIFAILQASRITLPLSTLLSFGVSLFMLYLIIKEVKVKKPVPPQTDN
ncbi:hypothetical protein AB685_04760 [Bacillus sp. LL01]|uniref:DUF1189 domain-containing protein n=1 Tax=Bacillus sp. LL01 TaxID=1665556 RepID=UPI00064D4EFA|nr:DUF1189 domain-containing protein [Bacillus sp. LL01]KMJ60147.1 hypothetical protein AB685_04760 [Bacillus sp. LL01]